MAESLLATVNGMLDDRSVGCVAEALGISEESAWKGLQSAIASVLGGIAAKAESPDSLRAVLDLAPKTLGDNPLLQAARGAPDPNSSLLVTGRHLLARIFGSSGEAVSDVVGAASGLSGATASTLLAMVAPMVMGFIGNRARLQGMNMNVLGNLLKQETPAIREALPAGLESLFWPESGYAVSPATASSTEGRGSPMRWISALVLALLILGLILLFSHLRRPATPSPTPTAGTKFGSASRTSDDEVGMARRALGNTELYFDAGSTKLRPESRAQLDTIASTLASYPDVHLTLTGHTDNASRQEQGSDLSQRRANAVMAELMQKGVPADHLTAEGASNEQTTDGTSGEEERAGHGKVTLEFSEH